MLSPFIPVTASLQASVSKQSKPSQQHKQQPIVIQASPNSEDTDPTPIKVEEQTKINVEEERSQDSIIIIEDEQEPIQPIISDGEEDELNATDAEEPVVISDNESIVVIDKEDKNIVSVLTHDHHRVKGLYDKYRYESSLQEKMKIRNQIIGEILKQDECQQSVVYTCLKETPFSEERLDQCLETHQVVREKLCDIRDINIDQDPEYDQKMEQVMAKAIMHMDLEELSMGEFLKKNMSEQELEEIGTKYIQQKQVQQ